MIKMTVIASSLLTTGVCFAANLPQGSWYAELMSVQNGQPKIVIKENNTVEYYIDNRCRFDTFGDIGACMRNFIVPHVTIAKYSYGSNDGTKKVYKLANTNYSIVTLRNQPNKFLVEDNSGNILYSIPLNLLITILD